MKKKNVGRVVEVVGPVVDMEFERGKLPALNNAIEVDFVPEGQRGTESERKLVVEVAYDQTTGNRFRHGTKLLRFRPDKSPRQCTFEQIAPPAKPPIFVADMLKS